MTERGKLTASNPKRHTHSMDRQVHNIDPVQIAWFAQRCQIPAAKAQGVLNFYGFCEYITAGGGKVCAKGYATTCGLSYSTVKGYVGVLRSAGFITADHKAKGIPFGEEIPEPAPAPTPTPAPAPKQEKPKQEKPKKEKAPDLSGELIRTWNQYKPKQWVALQSLSPSRLRSIKALGGYQAVIDLLPKALTGAKEHDFWGKKKMTWENVVGGGSVPKGHLQSLAESCSVANPNNPDTLEEQPKSHPDFFEPDPWGYIHPKHNKFKDSEDRDRREAEARKFYKSLS